MPTPHNIGDYRGGRPKGALNKKTRLKLELFGTTKPQQLPLTPTQVLAANMEFFQGKGDEFLKRLNQLVQDGADPADLQHVLDQACKYKILANDCASTLAPYVHPKVAVAPPSVEEAKPFVIRVPDALPSPEAWAHAIAGSKVIEAKASKE